jgi:hypothetical protein
MTILGIASGSLKKGRNPLERRSIVRVKPKRGKILRVHPAGIRSVKIRNPNREEQKKFQKSGSSHRTSGLGIYSDTAEIFPAVSTVLSSVLIEVSDSDTEAIAQNAHNLIERKVDRVDLLCCAMKKRQVPGN